MAVVAKWIRPAAHATAGATVQDVILQVRAASAAAGESDTALNGARGRGSGLEHIRLLATRRSARRRIRGSGAPNDPNQRSQQTKDPTEFHGYLLGYGPSENVVESPRHL
jgi:hypothetical protein